VRLLACGNLGGINNAVGQGKKGNQRRFFEGTMFTKSRVIPPRTAVAKVMHRISMGNDKLNCQRCVFVIDREYNAPAAFFVSFFPFF
jgi:hypothetical protein